MTKAKGRLQWAKLGEGVLADWRGALDDKGGVRLEQDSTRKNWGPWHMRKGETLVAGDTMRAKSLVLSASQATDGNYKEVPLAVLEALETYAGAALKGQGLPPASLAEPGQPEKAPEFRMMLPVFEEAELGEYALDVTEGPLVAWTVRVVLVSSKEAQLVLEHPQDGEVVQHGRYRFDADGGLLLGVGEACRCGSPGTAPGDDHSHVHEALELAQAALTAEPTGAADQPAPRAAEERPRIADLTSEQRKGDVLRRWMRTAHIFGEGGKISEAIESLPVPLTHEARLAKADLLASTFEEDGELDVEEKAFKEKLKRRREDVELRRQKLVAEVQSRKEFRDVRTMEVVVYPLRAVWRIRTDTYEIVDSRSMDLADQSYRVYAEDDSSAPFHSRPRVESPVGEEDEEEPAPRARKKRPPAASELSLSVTTAQVLDLEPEEQRRKATPDSTSDMTVQAPVKHRCQRARCGHSEADHSGSSGQCMASIRVELDGRPGETCACTAYVPPPGAMTALVAQQITTEPETEHAAEDSGEPSELPKNTRGVVLQ
jgi:hypothetical protein